MNTAFEKYGTAALDIDGYKLGHVKQYPDDTRFIQANFTPRASRVDGVGGIIFFGLQYFIKKYLIEDWNSTFFGVPWEAVAKEYRETVDAYIPGNNIDLDHLEYVHKLGYLPIKIMALPEGRYVPLRVPVLTIENTDPECFWLPNYLETIMSNMLWHPSTSATTAFRYRKILDKWAERTGDPGFVPWQGHDFSFRGLPSREAAAMSGAGHLTSFTGTDTIPAIRLIKRYYGMNGGVLGGSVNATEHSVMCAGGKEDELRTISRLLDVYPTGILSVVSDTWDLWHVITEILPKLSGQIMGRDGKLVIRPDSGDPVDIICGLDSRGDFERPSSDPEDFGVIELLWQIFGGTRNEKGYKVLDQHIGAIYGDSITPDRAEEIACRLESKGFASTNVVLGIGSYTYQYVTRDTYGWAMKATFANVGGEERELFKKPVTDNGVKFSARGRLTVKESDGTYVLKECSTIYDNADSAMKMKFLDGVTYNDMSFNEIRDNVTLELTRQ